MNFTHKKIIQLESELGSYQNIVFENLTVYLGMACVKIHSKSTNEKEKNLRLEVA